VCFALASECAEVDASRCSGSSSPACGPGRGLCRSPWCRPVEHELQLPLDADRCDVTVRGEQVVEWEEFTTIIDGPVHVKSSEVVAAVGISEISDGRATFAFEEDAVTVDVGRVMLVGHASVHLMAVDGETVRFAVDFSPAGVSAE
jgi:hypothetical protein